MKVSTDIEECFPDDGNSSDACARPITWGFGAMPCKGDSGGFMGIQDPNSGRYDEDCALGFLESNTKSLLNRDLNSLIM